MKELESYSQEWMKRLDEVGELGEIPENLALVLRCLSSPGAERLLKIPDDLHRFEDMPMRVCYVEDADSKFREKDGVFNLDSIETESESCVSKLANVKENRDTLLAKQRHTIKALLAKAGFLSGSTGIESVPGPELPQIEVLKRFNEENQKKYAENDARFKSSPLLQGLLEKSRLNKEKNSKEIQDKYCIRGAEWRVGDCSVEGMTPDEKDKFIAMLKERAGMKD